MSSGDREYIIETISERLGFDFSEENVSPKLRREIGQIAKDKDYYDSLVATKDDAIKNTQIEVALTIIFIILGLLLIWLLVGVIFWVIAFFSYWAYTKDKATAKNKEIEANSLWSDLNNRIKQLSELIYKELSLLHEARVRPTVKHVMIDFARIVQAARGRGIILSNIECPYCNGVVEIPPTGEYFKCQYCGKTIHATKIFEKLKDILTQNE